MGDTENNKSLVDIAAEAQDLAGRLPSADQRELALLTRELALYLLKGEAGEDVVKMIRSKMHP